MNAQPTDPCRQIRRYLLLGFTMLIVVLSCEKEPAMVADQPPNRENSDLKKFYLDETSTYIHADSTRLRYHYQDSVQIFVLDSAQTYTSFEEYDLSIQKLIDGKWIEIAENYLYEYQQWTFVSKGVDSETRIRISIEADAWIEDRMIVSTTTIAQGRSTYRELIIPLRSVDSSWFDTGAGMPDHVSELWETHIIDGMSYSYVWSDHHLYYTRKEGLIAYRNRGERWTLLD